eukprot:CAMPEP_0185698354 /NCGR_PEP_ID=MMETSP1164-20130828/6286_1 /TAXON_ID=1104430 /ORGANISM="Chrysoreinhardia sp, Strain CCMP2950" /LENGTH=226 /DNA_ID=CAMNT_0028365269 /DNA_START=179 /DNA_END=859 /DNA_ORIENTATION=-
MDGAVLQGVNTTAAQSEESLTAACTFAAPNSSAVGCVVPGAATTIWYGATIIGFEPNSIEIAPHSVVGDCVQIVGSGTQIDDNVNIGANAVLLGVNSVARSVTIEAGVVLCEGVQIGPHSCISAGSIVAANTVIGSGELWAGRPAMVQNTMSAKACRANSDSEVQLSKFHLQSCKDAAMLSPGAIESSDEDEPKPDAQQSPPVDNVSIRGIAVPGCIMNSKINQAE